MNINEVVIGLNNLVLQGLALGWELDMRFGDEYLSARITSPTNQVKKFKVELAGFYLCLSGPQGFPEWEEYWDGDAAQYEFEPDMEISISKWCRQAASLRQMP